MPFIGNFGPFELLALLVLVVLAGKLWKRLRK